MIEIRHPTKLESNRRFFQKHFSKIPKKSKKKFGKNGFEIGEFLM